MFENKKTTAAKKGGKKKYNFNQLANPMSLQSGITKHYKKIYWFAISLTTLTIINTLIIVYLLLISK